MPVRLTGKDWGAQVAAACGATYLLLGGGSSISIKVYTALSLSQFLTFMPAACAFFPLVSRSSISIGAEASVCF